MVLLGQAGVADDQGAPVEDVVADQRLDELLGLLAEGRVLALQLLDGLGQAVGDLDLAAVQVAAELVLVVAGDAQGVAGGDHAHGQAQHAGAVGAPVDEVADEDDGAPLGVGGVHGPAGVVAHEGVAEGGEQALQLGAAAVDVADDVEGAGEVAQVVEPALPDDLRRLHLVGAAQDVHGAEALALEVAQGAAQLALVALDDAAREGGAVGAGGVALGADALGDVEDDRDGQHVVLARQADELLAGVGLDVGGVDDGQPAGGQALADDVVQDVEGVLAGALVVLVVADQAAAEVGGDGLGGLEVPGGEGGLAGAGGADEDHERQVGHGEGRAGTGGGHAAFASFVVSFLLFLSEVLFMSVLVKTAIWVGGPTSGSSGPTGANSTA